MILLIYITSGAAVTLLILGVYWLQPERIEKMYYRGDQHQTTLITTIRPLIKFLSVFNQKLNIEKLDRKYTNKKLHIIADNLSAHKHKDVAGKQ